MKPLAQAIHLARYNGWMNAKLYECSARLTDTQRKEDVGAFFKSIHGTLNHLLLADNIWMGRFEQRPFAAKSLDQQLHADFGGTAARVVQVAGKVPVGLLLESLGNVGHDPRRSPIELSAKVARLPQPRGLKNRK